MDHFKLLSQESKGLTLSEKWILLTILNHEDVKINNRKAKLSCSLSILERLSGLSSRTVRRAIDDLKDKNVLVILNKIGSRIYTINLNNNYFRGGQNDHPTKKDRGGLSKMTTPKLGGTVQNDHPYPYYKYPITSKKYHMGLSIYIKRAHAYSYLNIYNNITKLCSFFGEYENLSLDGNISAKSEKPSNQKKPVKFEDECKRVLDYFSTKSGVKYRGSKAYLPLFRGRLSEGATVEEMIRVIDSRFAAWWEDDYMRQHFNPTTLFRPANFYKYLAACEIEGQHDNEQKKIRHDKVKTLNSLFLKRFDAFKNKDLWMVSDQLPDLFRYRVEDIIFRLGKRYPELSTSELIFKFKDQITPRKPI